MNVREHIVGHGSRVTLHFSIRLENGMVAEDTFGGEPEVVDIGSGQMAPWLERPLLGMRTGDRETFRIPPETGFGFPSPEAVQEMPRSDFPEPEGLEPGQIIEFTSPGGDSIPGTVLKVGEDRVRIDFNHPFAGHELTFEVQILAVGPAGRDDLDS